MLTLSIVHQGLEVHGDLSYNWCRPPSSCDIPRIQKCNHRMSPSGLLKCRKDLAPKSRSSRAKTTLTSQTGWWCHTQYADRWRTSAHAAGESSPPRWRAHNFFTSYLVFIVESRQLSVYGLRTHRGQLQCLVFCSCRLFRTYAVFVAETLPNYALCHHRLVKG